jgi:hypothetical protein
LSRDSAGKGGIAAISSFEGRSTTTVCISRSADKHALYTKYGIQAYDQGQRDMSTDDGGFAPKKASKQQLRATLEAETLEGGRRGLVIRPTRIGYAHNWAHSTMTPKPVQLGGSTWLALVASAFATRDSSQTHKSDYFTLVYLLNPSDPHIWSLVDQWLKERLITVGSPDGRRNQCTLTKLELERLSAELPALREQVKASSAQADAADELSGLAEQGRLEEAVREQLQLKGKVLATRVEGGGTLADRV